MPKSAVEIVRAVLDDPLNLESVTELVAADATYVSLNFSNPELKQVMPWAGTSENGFRAHDCVCMPALNMNRAEQDSCRAGLSLLVSVKGQSAGLKDF